MAVLGRVVCLAGTAWQLGGTGDVMCAAGMARRLGNYFGDLEGTGRSQMLALAFEQGVAALSRGVVRYYLNI